jgi:hypothetical protein
MAWIKSDEDIWDHPKTLKMKRLLPDIPVAYIAGCLHSLWHFTLRHAWHTADLSKWDDGGIEHACRWEGPPGVFVAALRESSYLDGSVAHGWMERAGPLVEDRIRKENGRRKSKDKRGPSSIYPVESRKVPDTSRKVPDYPGRIPESPIEDVDKRVRLCAAARPGAPAKPSAPSNGALSGAKKQRLQSRAPDVSRRKMSVPRAETSVTSLNGSAKIANFGRKA